MEQPIAETGHVKEIPFLLLGGLLVIAFGSSIIPAHWFGIEKQEQNRISLSALIQPGSLATDVNKDGDISWREFVASSLEIPAEETDVALEVDPEVVEDINNPNNLTSSFSKNLYIASTALNQNGITDESIKQDVINNLIAEEVEKIESKKYSQAEISTVASSQTTLKKYGNEMGALLKDFITEDDVVQTLASLDAYMNAATPEDLLPLKAYTREIIGIMSKLKVVQVPTTAVAIHVEILNRVEEYKDLLINLSAIEDDAVRSTAAIKKYSIVTVAALQTQPLLTQFFIEQKVTFSTKDAGYIYSPGYTAP